MNWILVFIGGGIGSLLRYGISVFFQKQNSLSLPYATLWANLVACVVFALVFIIYQQKDIIPTSVRMLLLTGFCGGLSTFSAFSFETVELMKRGELLYAVLNVIVNLFLCLLVFYLLVNKETV